MPAPSLEVLYQDEHFIAINKPTGIQVHRTARSKDPYYLLQTLRDQVDQHVFPIHRLDKRTTGALIFGLTPEAAGSLSNEFWAKQVQKMYLAIVRGYAPDEITVERPLAKEGGEKKYPAKTTFRCLHSIELPIEIDKYPRSRYSLVEAIPYSGRTHQIRRHLNAISHPIIGDNKHGDYRHNTYFRENFQMIGMYLHCAKLSFIHPISQAEIKILAPFQEDFKAMIRLMGWDYDWPMAQS